MEKNFEKAGLNNLPFVNFNIIHKFYAFTFIFLEKPILQNRAQNFYKLKKG